MNNKTNARISFIVPCYNCADTIVDGVESIFQQHLDLPFEIVCTDDCSTDTTPQMLESLARRHPELKVLRHYKNRGGAAARNTCARNSSGDLIFCLDADNVLAPDSVGLLVDALERTGCEAASFSILRYFQVDGGAFRELEPWVISAPGNVCGIEHIMTTLKTPAASGNYLYTRASYDRAGGYPEGRGAMDAWGFGFRQHATGTRIAIVPGAFYLHRVSPNGYWTREQKKGTNDINAASVVLEFPHLLSKRAQAFLRGPESGSRFFEFVDQGKFAVTGNAKSGVLVDLTGGERIVPVSASEKPLRLHLGCGQRMLAGYVNIDYPPSEHTVQDTSVADAYADITTLSFPDASVDEVRLHHLFEHFEPALALALLCRWNAWLKDDGVLCIETPDALECCRMVADPSVSYKDRQAVLRHVFGSHEAHWAMHKDGWYEEKFRTVLGALGFGVVRLEKAAWKATRNIIVTAKKTKSMTSGALRAQAKALLKSSMIDDAASEERLWRVWCDDFDRAYALDRAQSALAV